MFEVFLGLLIADIAPPMVRKMLCSEETLDTLILLYHNRIRHRDSLLIHIHGRIYLVEATQQQVRVCKALFALLHVVCTIFSTHDGASQFQHPHATLMVNAAFVQFTSLIALALASIYDALEQKGSRNRTVALPIFLNKLVCIFAHYINTFASSNTKCIPYIITVCI